MVKMIESTVHMYNKVIKRVNRLIGQCETPLQWVPSKHEHEAGHVIRIESIPMRLEKIAMCLIQFVHASPSYVFSNKSFQISSRISNSFP